MYLEVEDGEGSFCLRVRGPVGVAETMTLLKTAANLLGRHEVEALRVDLSGVSYLDPGAVSGLARLHEHAERQRQRLEVLGPPELAMKLLSQPTAD